LLANQPKTKGHIVKKILYLFIITLLFSCSSTKQKKINWNNFFEKTYIANADSMLAIDSNTIDKKEGNYVAPIINYDDTRKHLNFPQEAIDWKLTGDVIVRVLVSEKGEIKNLFIEHSDHEIFNKPAVYAILNTRITPAYDENDKPVQCWISIPIKFRHPTK
jgi:TonB family protein